VRAHCTDAFYRNNFDDYKQIRDEKNCDCVEMESAALFANANLTGKKASALLTVSDHLVTGEKCTAKERE